MEEVAERILDDVLPSNLLRCASRSRLKEVALTMLDEMDEDSVEECLGTIIAVMKEEYGE